MSHFVAHLKIEKVDFNENRDRGSSTYGQKAREISEVTQLTIKDSTLEGLVVKLGKHVQIIEGD